MSERRKLLEHFEKKEWREKAEESIERNRKGDATITVVDAQGNPVKGAKVKVNLKKHAFKFGANIFMLDGFETEEKNASYKEQFASLFNMATIPFYWNTLEPEQGKTRYEVDSPYIYRRPTPDACLAFCEANGIEPREHALAYEQHFPKWLSGLDVDTVKKLLEERFAEISRRYAHRIPTIEVTNEMFWEKGITEFYFAPDYLPWCYEKAEKYFPNNRLSLNDNWCWRPLNVGGWDNSYLQLEKLVRMGYRIDEYAMQFHMFYTREKEEWNITFKKLYDPEYQNSLFDSYTRLVPHLSISEVTIPSYSWEKEDEEFQADVIENLYTLWFAHPSIDQVIYWNLVDGYGFGAEPGEMEKGENYYHGGLLHFDLTPKPAYLRLKELVTKKWHTEAELVTDENGQVDFRGFWGDYDVEITVGDTQVQKTVSHKKDQPQNYTVKA